MRTVTIQVVAALLYRENRLLVCQRKENGSFPLKWEFPGGKVERGEGNLAALCRELREELGIEVLSATEIFRHKHLYPDRTEVDLTFFRVDDYREPVANRVFQQILWVEVQRLKELDFLEGDLPLIEKLARQEIIF
ncbi:MAG TPA: (deoxy)nucleoside triphosphate pyrophosphohydrolase [bacterium]|nr:(deoxy)nucleoside triphosphate pyrophosphohydrolase [bacterium]